MGQSCSISKTFLPKPRRGCVTPLRIYLSSLPVLSVCTSLCTPHGYPRLTQKLRSTYSMSHRRPRPSLCPPLLLRFGEQKFSAFTIPSAIVSLSSHSTEPDQIPPGRSTRGERDVDFLFSFFLFVIPSLDRWMRALNIQREGRLFFFFFFFFLHPPGGWETHSGLKHSDERWFRCTREQREETGRNGVGVRSLSPSLLPPSQPPRARPSPDRRGGACAWPSVGVADATTFEARVCFRGKLDIEPIFLPSRFLSIKKLRLFLC